MAPVVPDAEGFFYDPVIKNRKRMNDTDINEIKTICLEKKAIDSKLIDKKDEKNAARP